MADKYKRLQAPLNENIPEHMKLYKYVMQETRGKGIGEFMRDCVRLRMEGKSVSSQLGTVNVRVEEHNDDYMEGLIL